MATRHNMLMTRLRDTLAYHGHAMPICMEKACIGGGSGFCGSLVFTVVAQGCSVPISWESPPTLLE